MLKGNGTIQPNISRTTILEIDPFAAEDVEGQQTRRQRVVGSDLPPIDQVDADEK